MRVGVSSGAVRAHYNGVGKKTKGEGSAVGAWFDREAYRRIGVLRLGVVVFGFALYWSYIFLVYFGPVTFVGAPADDLNNQLFRAFGHAGAGVFMLAAWRFGLPKGQVLRAFDWAMAIAAPLFVVATSLYAQGVIGPALTCAAWFVTGLTAGHALFATTAVLVRFGTGLAAFACIASTALAALVYCVVNALGFVSLVPVSPMITLSIACAVILLRDINAGLDADAIPMVFDGTRSNEEETEDAEEAEGASFSALGSAAGETASAAEGAACSQSVRGASAGEAAGADAASAAEGVAVVGADDADRASIEGIDANADAGTAGASRSIRDGARSLPGKSLARMLRVMNANALFHGLISGTVNCIVLTTLSATTPFAWAMFAAFVASCLIMCLLLRWFSNVMSLQTLALPVSGTIAVAALLLLGFTDGAARLACAAVLVVCFTVHDIVNIVRLVDTVLHERLSTVKTCGSRRCFNSLGVAAGWLVGWAVLPVVLVDDAVVLPISAALAFLLVMLLASQSICNIAFPVQPYAPEVGDELGIDASSPARGAVAAVGASAGADAREGALSDKMVSERALATLAQRYKISERELDVLAPLVRGRSAQRIADELFLSKNTVRTHIYHIYAKMGLHTQQDVIDKFEKECERTRRVG